VSVAESDAVYHSGMADPDAPTQAESTLAELRERNRSFPGPHEALMARELVDRLAELGALDMVREIAADRDMNPFLREHAVSILGDARHPEDLSLVMAMMRDDYIQDLAQLVLEQSWDADAVPALLARLPHRDDDALCLIEALGNVGDERALVPLSELLHSRDEGEQSFACEAILAIAQRGHANASEAARAAVQAAVDWEPPNG
jgi:HEAT repeat protein